MMLSMPVEIKGKTFRYDYSCGVVRYVAKATDEDIAMNESWMKRHTSPLFEIDDMGYMLLDSIGLSRMAWDNVETRSEYLSGWCDDLDEEIERLTDDFLSELK